MLNLLDRLTYTKIKVKLIKKAKFFILHKDKQLKRSLMKKTPKIMLIRNFSKEVIVRSQNFI